MHIIIMLAIIANPERIPKIIVIAIIFHHSFNAYTGKDLHLAC